MCVDGRKQKDFTWSMQDTKLPTVATKSVFITAIIDVHKGHNIACLTFRGHFYMQMLKKTLPWSSRAGWRS
jgi:hypothetical protein